MVLYSTCYNIVELHLSFFVGEIGYLPLMQDNKEALPWRESAQNEIYFRNAEALGETKKDPNAFIFISISAISVYLGATVG